MRAAARRRNQQQQNEESRAEFQEAIRQAAEWDNERERIRRQARDEERRAERDFNRERQQRIEEYNLETRHREEEHIREMRRMQEDANRRLNAIATERDAVSYLQEWENSRTQIQRAEQDYQEQSRQREEQEQLRRQQEEQDFQAQQEQRRQQAQQQLEDLRQQIETENQVRDDGYQLALNSAQSFADQIRDIFEQASRGSGGNRNSYTSNNSVTVNTNNPRIAQDAINNAVDQRMNQTMQGRNRNRGR
jgi:hypothetical protein